MPDRPWKDEYTLLCEKCGYVIEGLDQSGNCPECGKPIAESLPERRVGTPWQQSPGVGSLVRTWWMTLRHPLRTLDVMRVDGLKATSLRWTTILIAACIPAPLSFTVWIESGGNVLWFTGFFVLTPLLLTMGLILLTRLEAEGLCFFSKRRHGRLDRRASLTVVSHGCVGWLIVSTGVLLGTVLLWLTATSALRDRPTGVTNFFGLGALTFLSLTPLLGFLFFETFAYLGLRRCKYANRVRPDAS